MNTPEVNAVDNITKFAPGKAKYKNPKQAKKEKPAKPVKAAKPKVEKPAKPKAEKPAEPKEKVLISMGISSTGNMPAVNLGGLGDKPRQFKGK